jgi:uncharacterized membrane protein
MFGSANVTTDASASARPPATASTTARGFIREKYPRRGDVLNDYYFSGDTLLAGNHSLWGWLYIAAGVFLLLLAPLVFAHDPAGVVLATFAVALNALSHLLGFGHRFGWSIAALVIDGLVLFALINYGIRIQELRRRANPLEARSLHTTRV